MTPGESALFIEAYTRMPLHWQDQFQAHMRDAVEVVVRICEWMEAHPELLAEIEREDRP